MSETINTSNTFKLILISVSLIFITASAMLSKYIVQTSYIDIYGKERLYEKPFFMSLIMFISISLAMPTYYILFYYFRYKYPHQEKMINKKNQKLVDNEVFTYSSRYYSKQNISTDKSPLLQENPININTPTSSKYTIDTKDVRQNDEQNPTIYGSLLTDKYNKMKINEEINKNTNTNVNKYEHYNENYKYSLFIDINKNPYDWIDYKILFILSLIAMQDLLSTALCTIALTYTPLTTVQILRSSIVPLSIVLRKIIINKPLSRQLMVGIGFFIVSSYITILDLYINPTPSDFNDASYMHFLPKHLQSPIVSSLLVFLSCFFQSLQLVMEEERLSNTNISPMLVAGIEGVCGIIISIFVVGPLCYYLPGYDNGSTENFIDAFYALFSNYTIFITVVLYSICVYFYNILSLYITFFTNAIIHSAIDISRQLTVWLFSTCIYYMVGKVGRPFTMRSIFDVISIILLIYGFCISNNLFIPSYFNFIKDKQDDKILYCNYNANDDSFNHIIVSDISPYEFSDYKTLESA